MKRKERKEVVGKTKNTEAVGHMLHVVSRTRTPHHTHTRTLHRTTRDEMMEPPAIESGSASRALIRSGRGYLGKKGLEGQTLLGLGHL